MCDKCSQKKRCCSSRISVIINMKNHKKKIIGVIIAILAAFGGYKVTLTDENVEAVKEAVIEKVADKTADAVVETITDKVEETTDKLTDKVEDKAEKAVDEAIKKIIP